jgi:hypothetical protein
MEVGGQFHASVALLPGKGHRYPLYRKLAPERLKGSKSYSISKVRKSMLGKYGYPSSEMRLFTWALEHEILILWKTATMILIEFH